ncbi:TRAP transporter small permease [uncultured Maritalea sp.]|uniref:TRAP transporter small permease n=1 Tax=uncultured Maritalea sp. TaxID=757249 RepID=UPI00260A29AE|nr:TRAP transporter small permease subunit [uncultured Maritalea sp.]
MRTVLDRIYLAAGSLSAICILTICVIVTMQVVFNLITKLLGTQFAYTIPSYADFAGFLLAAASFLALSYTLKHDGHIRVTLFRDMIKGPIGHLIEITTLLICAAGAAFMTYSMFGHLMESIEYGDVSTGIIPIPLWIPQSTLLLGLALFTLALIDNTVIAILGKKPPAIDDIKEEHLDV